MATALLTAFGFGFLARMLRLPPLVGYLVAGFALHGLGFESNPTIEIVSETGILLLLFGIGLKVKAGSLARPVVWATAGSFALVGTVIVAGVLLALGVAGFGPASGLTPASAATVGFALSFSSTVFAVKALEQANESGSLAGRLAIGVLIIQDLMAVGFLALTGGSRPGVWALPVLLLFPLVRKPAGWLLDRAGHGEVLLLLGLAVSVGLGAGLFGLVGLKPDLGAVAVGLTLASHPRASELADRVLGFKDVFLVGFFLSIGLRGTPPPTAWALGLVLVLLMPARSVVLYWLLTRFRLRSRTAFHSSLTLSTFSEFGLIVAAAAFQAGLLDGVWVATVAVATAVSLIVAAVLNSVRYRLFERWNRGLGRFERRPIAEADALIDFTDARVLIFGMGRVGSGAYDELVSEVGGLVLGVDRSDEVVRQQVTLGRRVVRGDALDREFWERVTFHPELRLVVAAMSSHRANLECVGRVKEFVPASRIAAIATYADQVLELQEAGVDVARNLYHEAGQALAIDASELVESRPDDPPSLDDGSV